MRKRILIGVIVVVLALGAIGAAFATTMSFDGVGAISAGGGDIPEVNCTYVGYSTELNVDDEMFYITDAYLKFDRDLRVCTDIAVGLFGDDGQLGGGTTHLDSPVSAGSVVTVEFGENKVSAVDFWKVNEVQVAVVE
jgi:hypothetical protein